MSLRAMNKQDAELAKEFVEKYGKVARLKDLNEFRVAKKVGVSYILARATKVKRGEFDFTRALEVAEAVLAGQTDPSAPTKVKPVKAAKTKTVKPKAKAKTKTVKAKAKTKPTVTVKPPKAQTPATVEQLIEKIDEIEQSAKA